MRLKNNDVVKVPILGKAEGVVWGRDEATGWPLVCFDFDSIRQFQLPNGDWPGGIRQFSGRSARIIMLLAVNTDNLQLKTGRAT